MAQDASVKNLGELRQFGRNLSVASSNLTQLFQQLTQQMHRVCDSWQDDKNQAFMAEFEQKKAEIDKMSQTMQQYSQFIGKSCDILEQYQSLRM